jgi:hypothetical protein
MVKPSAKHLTDIFEYLPEQDRKTLCEFAEFLKSRAPEPEPEIHEPLEIPRPEEESVVAAIRRLKQTYPMLPQKALLNETSNHMMAHMMQGKPAMDVIDELEQLFAEKFEQFMGRRD